ncbi:hypothetical protein HYU23_01380 [Candidatus Woesearchaeota archaeon]|nr:hypothetical protein [Candidatus Woesearchaeota archaeon]
MPRQNIIIYKQSKKDIRKPKEVKFLHCHKNVKFLSAHVKAKHIGKKLIIKR